MAIAPTGDIYKALSFDNVSSRGYGVYITGQAVYNAPERDVEMITIPGRNGTFALDNGRFQNIEVSYPASIAAETEADFISAISEFRNFLCSKKGYCRLTDEYNPNEYRMAVYKSGLEVDPTQLRAGEFTITFDCKPQRFLTSGETAVSVASGGTLSNPTLFESSPLLEVSGYGTISLETGDVEILETYIGEIFVINGYTSINNTKVRQMQNTEHLMAGDRIYTKNKTSHITAKLWGNGGGNVTVKASNATSKTNCISTSVTTVIANSDYEFTVVPDLSAGFRYGTASTLSASAVFPITVTVSGTTTSHTITVNYVLQYDGNDQVTIWGDIAHCVDLTNPWGGSGYAVWDIRLNDFWGDSTEIAPLDQVFIDLDVGEAYGVVDDQKLSYNNIVSLPANLPTLVPDSNEITFDNTITSLKITPRWWKV